MPFRNQIGKDVFDHKYKYREGNCGTWEELSHTLVHRVCDKYMIKKEINELIKIVTDMKFIPAGRYLYYAGREAAFFNNCMTFIAEDSREGWAELAHKHFMSLMAGGGCGTYYGKIRPRGRSISKTGGDASGPIPLMMAMNEIGRHVRQGGSRRSALFACLPYDHQDIEEFLHIKDWSDIIIKAKSKDIDFPAPLDMTNISIAYNSYESTNTDIFKKNVLQACKTSEPGFAFNFGSQVLDIARNACAEVTSPWDSDVCNLGSVNMSRVNSIDEFEYICCLANKFLICGSLEADLPTEKMKLVRNMSRKIGLGLTGVHEWLIKRNYKYGFNTELDNWLTYYEDTSSVADEFCSTLGISPLSKYRSIAPAGTLSIIAGTTSGIEPVYAHGIKRKYLNGNKWREETFVDPTVKYLVEECGVDPDIIETSQDLAKDIERRVAFQAHMQDFVDMGISSTINLPAWGSEFNNEDTVESTELIIRKYSGRLRGLTFYADGSRGGQPLTAISYSEAIKFEQSITEDSVEVLESTSCKGGVCGI